MPPPQNPPPYLPYEFTYEGMLERVAVLLENQEFCTSHQWPPATVLETRVSKEGESCKDACYREGMCMCHCSAVSEIQMSCDCHVFYSGMVCEPELFHLLNSKQALQK